MGVSIGALISLADIYVIDNRFDEAAEMVGRAARIDRKDPRVLLTGAYLGRRAGAAQGTAQAKPPEPAAARVLSQLLLEIEAQTRLDGTVSRGVYVHAR